MDKDNKKSGNKEAGEPKPGEGVRGLDTWKKLAQARAAHETEGGDAKEYFKRFGIEEMAPGADSQTMQLLDGKLGVVEPTSESRVDARRGVAAVVVAPVAAVAINVVDAVSAGGNVQLGVNLNVVKNWNETCGCGKPY